MAQKTHLSAFHDQEFRRGEQLWEGWLTRLYNLRRDKSGSYERPHKPVLLLSIIDLLDRGIIRGNEVPMSDELVETFKRYFEVVRKHNDKPTIENPFFFLSGDEFWDVYTPGRHEPLYVPGQANAGPSVAQFKRAGAFGRFDPSLWKLLQDPSLRHQLWEALISRYFPEDRDRLAALVSTITVKKKETVFNDALPPGRDVAFRQTILEIYDYTCSACGIRLLTSGLCLVQAAHIIPFSVSWNDKPTNGLALCPNHHWAMDRNLISPCPDKEHPAGVWRVNPQLDDRLAGQKDLVALSNRPVIPPSESKYVPDVQGLKWRCERLTAKYS